MAKTLRRPTKEMMLAVNAKIAGKTAEMNNLIKEFKLSLAELKKRVELRDGKKYDLRKKGGRPKGSKKKTAGKRGPGRPRATATVRKPEDILDLLDGRTKTVTLVRISHKVNELLDAMPKPEVEKVEKALNEAEELRDKYEAAMKLIGDDLPI